MTITRKASFLGMILSFLVLVPLAWPQGNLGGLTGNLTDESGAIVPEASITLRSQDNNNLYRAAMTGEGAYAFRAIPPGTYRLEAERAGFKKYVLERIVILTATTSQLDISMKVGEVSESITVSESPIALQTTSPEVSTVMQRKTLLDLPIAVGRGGATTAASGRRQPENFIFLTPGVTGIPWSKNVNGSPDFSQDLLYEGISAQLAVTPGFLAQTSPPYEAVEEFKVQNSLFPAEYGRGFGVVNFTLKSGTNQFHGTVFEFLRNDVFDARPFFARTRPRVRYNEYGFAVGGPVRLPKYDGRDKTFFNFNYTGLKNRPPRPGTLISVPTAAFRRGDFSGFTDAAGRVIPIFDPLTTQADGTRTQFPGNIIPENRISAVTKNALALLPQPDLPGYFNNYTNRQANPIDDVAWSLKVDQILTNRQRASFSMWKADTETISTNPLGDAETPFGRWGINPVHGINYRANYDYTIRPNLLHHFAFGYTRSNPTRQLDPRIGNDLIKLPGVPAGSPGFPTFNVNNNYGNLNMGNSDQQPNDPSLNKNFSFVDNLSWIRGRHQLKFGIDFRFFQYDNLPGTTDGGISGLYNFLPRGTANLTAADFASQGNGWASFLLGQVDNGSRLIPPPLRQMRNEFYSYYVEDVLKVTSKLTMTLGLRHELPTVVQELGGRQSVLNVTTPNPGAAGRQGALVFLKDGDRLVENYSRAYSPRFGLAYSLNEKTVIRTGFGIFFSPTNATSIGRFSGLFASGFSFRQDFPQTTSGRLPALILDTGIPAFTGTLPNTNPALNNGGSVDYINAASGKPGYASSWTFNIQRELPAQFLLDLGYVGQKGTALPAGLQNLNQVDSQYLQLGNVLNADITSAAAQAAGIQAPYAGFRGSVAQALRPFPQYTAIRNLFQPIGWSKYHSMQLRLQKRYANGSTLLTAYTLSKNIVSGGGFTGLGDDAAGGLPLDVRDYNRETRLAGFDRTHNLILSWTYELPFGKGKRFVSGATGVLNNLVGGWQITGIQSYQSGAPIGVGGGTNIPLFGGGNRPNRVSGASGRTSISIGEFDPALHRYLDINAFSQPAAFAFGNAAPNYADIRTFTFLNEDFSILKDVKIREGHLFQFRAEFFNLFNRVVFGGIGANINAPATFGTVSGQENVPRNIQFGLKYIF